jgi:hypothetical protein
MRESRTIFVRDFTGGPFAVSAADGERLYRCIEPMMRAGQSVGLSFAGITTVLSGFLNSAVGRLCKSFSEDRLGELLLVCDAEADVREVLERALRNARRYWENRDAFDQAWDEVVGSECQQMEPKMR